MSAGYLERAYGLSGRTAVVTGARTGIGRACAVAVPAGAGADVVLWGRSDGGMEDVAGDVRSLGVTARVVGAEMSDLEAVGAAADRVLAEHRVDILVNNAGMIARGPAAGIALAVVARCAHRQPLDSVFLLAERFGVPMTERGSGAIVNIASLLSFQGGLNVAGVQRQQARRHGSHEGARQRVGTARRERQCRGAGLRRHEQHGGRCVPIPTGSRAIRSRIPAGRWAEPDDIAGAVAFLASLGSASVLTSTATPWSSTAPGWADERGPG